MVSSLVCLWCSNYSCSAVESFCDLKQCILNYGPWNTCVQQFNCSEYTAEGKTPCNFNNGKNVYTLEVRQ